MSALASKWWELDGSATCPRWLFSGTVGLTGQRPAVQYLTGTWKLVAVVRKHDAPLHVGDRAHEYWALADGYLLAEMEGDLVEVEAALHWGTCELARIAFDGAKRCLEQAERASQAGQS